KRAGERGRVGWPDAGRRGTQLVDGDVRGDHDVLTDLVDALAQQLWVDLDLAEPTLGCHRHPHHPIGRLADDRLSRRLGTLGAGCALDRLPRPIPQRVELVATNATSHGKEASQ